MFESVLNTYLMLFQGIAFTAQEMETAYLVTFTEEILIENIRF